MTDTADALNAAAQLCMLRGSASRIPSKTDVWDGHAYALESLATRLPLLEAVAEVATQAVLNWGGEDAAEDFTHAEYDIYLAVRALQEAQ